MFGILISNNTVFPQLKVAGKDGADAKFRGEADDGEGGRLNSFFSRALSFLSTAEGKTFRPAEVVVIIVTNEVDLSVIGQLGSGLRMGVRVQSEKLSGFFAPTRQQMPALQSTRARVPDQNHSPVAENFWWAAQARRESPLPLRKSPSTTKRSQRIIASIVGRGSKRARGDAEAKD